MKELRFAVGDQQGLYSAVWKIWIAKDGSVYLRPQMTNRRLSYGLKVSLHPSCICRVAQHSSESREPLARWMRLPLTESFDPILAVLLCLDVQPYIAREPARKHVMLLKPAPEGLATYVPVYLTRKRYIASLIDAFATVELPGDVMVMLGHRFEFRPQCPFSLSAAQSGGFGMITGFTVKDFEPVRIVEYAISVANASSEWPSSTR